MSQSADNYDKDMVHVLCYGNLHDRSIYIHFCTATITICRFCAPARHFSPTHL